MSKIMPKIISLISDELEVHPDKIFSTSNLKDDFSEDSLDHVELTMIFEEEFGIEISDEEADELKTVQDIYDLIKTKKGGLE